MIYSMFLDIPNHVKTSMMHVFSKDYLKTMVNGSCVLKKLPKCALVLCGLFSTALLFSGLNYPDRLWKTFQHSICDDLPYHLRTMNIHHFTENEVYDYGLYLLDQILQEAGKKLTDFPSMPSFVRNWDMTTTNRLIVEQLNWDLETERASAETYIDMLNSEQRIAFNDIWKSIACDKGRSFFINGPGDTGKTFLEKTICHAVHAEGWIILCVASTGLTALLLPAG